MAWAAAGYRQGGTYSGGMGAASGSMAAAAPNTGRQAQCQLVAATGMAAFSRVRHGGGRVLLILNSGRAAPMPETSITFYVNKYYKYSWKNR